MNYTPNYHLPQWEQSDRILMTDFNEAMAGIEAGITSAQTSADTAGTAQTTADAAQAAAEAAQQTADTALAKANAAFAPTNPLYVIRSYTGTGTGTTHTMEVGFAPSAFFLVGNNYSTFAVKPNRGDKSLICYWNATSLGINASDSAFDSSGTTYTCMIFR